jgi:hypothetical protein
MRTILLGFLALPLACERAEPPPAAPMISLVDPGEHPALSVRAIDHVEVTPHPRGIGWYRSLSLAERKAADDLCAIHDADPCSEMPGFPGLMAPRGEVARELALFTENDRTPLMHHCRQRYGEGRGCNTPLVVVLDGGPIALAPASTAPFAFHRGSPVATDWPTAATPWIALDRDGDGAITAGDELFGDATPLAGGTATDGFAALATLDANHDGRIDRDDPAFASLVLWSDRNGDRASTPDELVPLASVVTSISLAHDTAMRASLTWHSADGALHTGAVVDLYLAEH